MTTVLFRRPPRRPRPGMPTGEILIEAPPEQPAHEPRSFPSLLMILPMVSGVGAMAFLFASGNGGTLTFVAGGLVGISLLGMVLAGIGNGPVNSRIGVERADYLRYLGQLRRQVRRAADQQQAALAWSFPAPDDLWSIAASPRRWERRPADADFGHARLGTGPQRLAVKLVPPETRPVEYLDPVSAAALRRFVRTHSSVRDQPIALSVRAFARVVARGERELVLDVVRALLAHLVTFHGPDDLRVVVLAAPGSAPDWDWVKWLPHGRADEHTDGAGPSRLVFDLYADFHATLGPALSARPPFRHGTSAADTDRHIVVLLDEAELPADHLLQLPGSHGVTVFDLHGGSPSQGADASVLVLDLTEDKLVIIQESKRTDLGRPDRMPIAVAEALARQLAPYTAPRRGPVDIYATYELLPSLGIESAEALDLDSLWRQRPEAEQLRIPLGLGPDGSVVELDLKESAQGGAGPHGLLVGAHGSGKSELLRTMVIALALTHSPDEVNFFFVSGHDQATIRQLDLLPHTAATLIGDVGEPGLPDRFREVVIGELIRRQDTLRSAGYSSHREYRRSRRAGAPLPPLPSLVLLCDEFSELLAASPALIDVFIQVGRLGRLLGVHLVLATHRLEEGRLRGLDTHLSYRIGLRTFSVLESRAVLGSPDAYELPRAPGHGYLRTHNEPTLRRFRAAYVSGPMRRPRPPSAAEVVVYVNGHVPMPAAVDERDHGVAPPSVLDVVVEQLRDHGTAVHRLC